MSEIGLSDDICPHCSKPTKVEVPPHHLFPGTLLNGTILIGKALGEGGFGITYVGIDITSGEKVAVKEYYPNGYVNRSNTVSPTVYYSISADGREFYEKGRSRFMIEAKTLAMFSGEEGIVHVRSFFEANNTAYIVMEYLEGMDLKEHLMKYGPMPAEYVVQILEPVMRALTKVHAQGLIHRDISPDNIRLTRNGVKLLDFGAARTVSAEANKSLSVMLKHGYAPEEQYRSRGNQGAWTDVYALSATMYKCITGKTPDDSNERVFSDQLKRPSELGFSVNPVIENAIMRGMGVFQKDRFQTVDELLCALKGESAPVRNNDQGIQGTETTVYGGNPVVGGPVYLPRKKNKKPLFIALGAVAVAVVVVLIIILSGGDGGGNAYKGASTCEKAVEGYVNCMMDNDIEGMFAWQAGDISLDDYIDYVYESYGDYGLDMSREEMKRELKESGSQAKADLEDEFGKGYKTYFSIEDEETLSTYEIEEILDDYNSILYDLGKSVIAAEDIEEAKYVYFDATIEGNGESETESSELFAVKIGSKWKIIDLSTMESMF